MSHGNLLTQKARYRSRCTGIRHQQSLHHLQAPHRQDPVPASGRDQACLEAAVFERLGGTTDYCAHPAGVARLRPDTGHLTVELDPQLGPEGPGRPLRFSGSSPRAGRGCTCRSPPPTASSRTAYPPGQPD